MTDRLSLVSTSAAMDGGLTAIADVSRALDQVGVHEHRLIGGVSVMLHIQRLRLDLPLRSTADADFGVPPIALRDIQLVEAIEALGYRKVAGNRWERPLDTRRVAAVDLLVPTYTSRARHTVRVGDVVTTEVPGLAEALRRRGVQVGLDLLLTDGSRLEAGVVLPDSASTLALKTWARTVRDEDRDAEDLWRCLEIAAADGVDADLLRGDATLGTIVPILRQQLAGSGATLDVITRGLSSDEAARRRTRIRALLLDVTGPS
jgi:hypothetical protein